MPEYPSPTGSTYRPSLRAILASFLPLSLGVPPSRLSFSTPIMLHERRHSAPLRSRFRSPFRFQLRFQLLLQAIIYLAFFPHLSHCKKKKIANPAARPGRPNPGSKLSDTGPWAVACRAVVHCANAGRREFDSRGPRTIRISPRAFLFFSFLSFFRPPGVQPFVLRLLSLACVRFLNRSRSRSRSLELNPATRLV
jgi:hypothetical protein